jgi:hypothetical protein
MSSLHGRSTTKEQVDIKKGRKTAVRSVSPPLPGEQLSNFHAAQTRQVLGTIESPNLEMTEQNVVAPTMREDADTEQVCIQCYILDCAQFGIECEIEEVSCVRTLGFEY